MRLIIFRVVLVLLTFLAFAEYSRATTLTNRSKIYLVTCGPGQNELYSAFGHTAIRVVDENMGLDIAFNYGVFDFDQPNFYLNFAKGNLLYQLAVADFDRFVYGYVQEGRSVLLQELNLDSAERQAYFDFLTWNAQPQNKTYNYDYFYDNCATRPRDGLQVALTGLGKRLQWETDYAKSDYSIRDLCEDYLYFQPWGDLGIDLCLGLPMDKKADPLEYTFLPDYLAKAASGGTITDAVATKPLVKNSLYLNEQTYQANRPVFTPAWCFFLLLALGILLSFIESKTGFSSIWFDRILFGTVGAIGWLLVVLWFFTDHNAAARNMNLLWALPIYFPILFFVKKVSGHFILFILRFSLIVQAITLAGWLFWPQELHPSLLGLSALLLWRSFWRVYVANKKNSTP